MYIYENTKFSHNKKVQHLHRTDSCSSPGTNLIIIEANGRTRKIATRKWLHAHLCD